MAAIPPLTDLITSLQHTTTLLTKQLSTITDPTHYLQLYSSLQTANNQLTSFLNHMIHIPPPQPGENSVFSAINGGNEEPMQIEEDEEESSMVIVIDKVEEKFKNCEIQNKRRKRPLSPSSTAAIEQREGFNGGVNNHLCEDQGFDPHGTRLRSVELVFQFHA